MNQTGNSSSHTVLVTGATGFLGRHVLRALRAAGHSAVVLVRDRAAWLSLPWRAEAGEVRIVEGSPLTADRWQFDAALASVTRIIHAAAMVNHSRRNTDEMVELNVAGTVQMVHVAKRLGARIVFVSSSGTVGCYAFSDLVADEDAPYAEAMVGRWPYYASKIRAEREAKRLADKLEAQLVVVRPPVLLGPDDHRRRSTGHVLRVLEQRVPAIPSGSMHFADIRDVAAAIVRIAELRESRPVYHLPGHQTSLADFFAQVAEVAGIPSPNRKLSPLATRALSKLAAMLPAQGGLPDPVVLEMSACHWGLSSLFADEIGYSRRAARQTLSDTVAWLRAHPPVNEVAGTLQEKHQPR
jgi:nucleoside-diphosphate-sugar epimerase